MLPTDIPVSNQRLAQWIIFEREGAIVLSLFLAVGIALLFFGTYEGLKTRQFLASGEKTTGQIIAFKTRTSSKTGGMTYYPVVQFSDTKGKTITFSSRTGSGFATYNKGDRVTVIYQPGDPSQAIIDDFFQLWFGTFLLLISGVVLSAAGGGFLYFLIATYRMQIGLLKSGTRIVTKLIGAERTSSKQRTYTIKSQWQEPESGLLYVFESLPLSYDPTSYLKSDQINVLIDPENPKRHLMDISDLPQTV